MKRRFHILLPFLILLIFILTSCSETPPFTEQKGNFDVLDNDLTELKYNQEVGEGFYASLDIQLEKGKVIWSIYSPNNELIYEGYVINRDGEILKAITYPRKPKDEGFNLESKIDGIAFSYLQIDQINNVGEHRLVLKPEAAKCKYIMQWYHRLPKK